ncbi:MAG: AIM24 family protein [Methanopyri archaeon]|nr:AIM24 family protein [Methanopyri archaeon]
MQTRIIGHFAPVMEVDLYQGETILCERGAMLYETPDIRSDAVLGMGFFSRLFTGESAALDKYEGPGTVAIAAGKPGMIKELDLQPGQAIDIAHSGFLAMEPSVQFSISLASHSLIRLIGMASFARDNLIFQNLTGPGKVFMHVHGDYVITRLEQGQTMMIDQGYLVFKDHSVELELVRVHGLENIVIGGEGLFLLQVTGPGYVGIQSMKG